MGHIWNYERTKINNYHDEKILTIIKDNQQNYYNYSFMSNNINEDNIYSNEKNENDYDNSNENNNINFKLNDIYDDKINEILKFYEILIDKELIKNINTLKKNLNLN